MSFRFLLVISGALLVSACASTPVFVDYSQSESTQGDWYPLPDDAPAHVEITTAELPRAKVTVAPEQAPDVDAQLSIERLSDSFGNVSLKLNRQPGAAWELVSSALDSANFNVLDRNRDEYQFQLGQNLDDRSLWALFKKREELKIVLIPQGSNCVIAVEGADDIAPDSQQVDDILSRLQGSLDSIQ